jgi:prolyl-tRNA editing enzyme YbaK/EbsC (Cys-tRNA(Pro) deacylase)
VSAVDRVVAALAAAGVDAEVRRFDESVPTAAVAARALGCEVGAIANSLVFDADGAPLLVLASGAHRVDTGKEVGGVAPLGHPALLRTVVDVDLAAHPVLWAGGGDHFTMFAISYDDLLRATGGEPAAVA